jgi:hypothetical protein
MGIHLAAKRFNEERGSVRGCANWSVQGGSQGFTCLGERCAWIFYNFPQLFPGTRKIIEADIK